MSSLDFPTRIKPRLQLVATITTRMSLFSFEQFGKIDRRTIAITRRAKCGQLTMEEREANLSYLQA